MTRRVVKTMSILISTGILILLSLLIFCISHNVLFFLSHTIYPGMMSSWELIWNLFEVESLSLFAFEFYFPLKFCLKCLLGFLSKLIDFLDVFSCHGEGWLHSAPALLKICFLIKAYAQSKPLTSYCQDFSVYRST